MPGNGIAMGFSKLPLSLDWQFASHKRLIEECRTNPVREHRPQMARRSVGLQPYAIRENLQEHAAR
jgi:hypothetical protein